ncbi:MAG TPA: methyl-accepting chemotaxis protein [Gammaproteobacteria bacterium]|nr:methyl-accepting chemotaxis protein [Gammaproteobacteria bacterium]
MQKISRKTFNFFRDFIRVLLVVLIFFTITIFWNLNQLRDFYQQYINHSTELRVLAQAIPKYSREALIGPDREDAFRNLKKSAKEMDEELRILFKGITLDQKELLPPTNEKIKFAELNALSSAWEAIKPKVNIILDNQELTLNLSKTSNRLIDNIEKVQDLYWGVIDALGKEKTDNNQIIIKIARQINLIERIVDEMQVVLTVANTPGLLKTFSANTITFFKNAEAIGEEIKNDELDSNMSEIEKYLKLVHTDVESTNKIGSITEKGNSAIFDILNQGPLLMNLSKNLQMAYINYPKTNTTTELYAYGLGLLSFLVLILSVQLFHKESERNLKMIEEKNKLMQTEVEKLLKELPEIASGNSSLSALVSLNIAAHPTQLAESFTYALSTIRKLVFNIGKMGKNVSLAAGDAQKITEELAISSGNQAQEISEVTASVSAMANTIEQVSANATESASVALASVKIAGEGGKVVRSTISGMERIQTQIQETSNFMRRLSDSSQEIGEIVSLIDGIADQTNILSLNASIQAAMAGEAGRGFAVVADEVQRLAEKVSYATKEISSLVRSIQTDTTQVIVAMDQTKAQVLEGVTAATAAGATLEQIETVSRHLSDLIQNISLSTNDQVAVSSKISHIMNNIEAIAQKTATGSMTTVELIGKLSQFVTDLRNSVVEL